MADDRLEVLKKARSQMAETRFALIEKLAGPAQSGETEATQEKLLQIQAVIEVIDAAMEDEEIDASSMTNSTRTNSRRLGPASTR